MIVDRLENWKIYPYGAAWKLAFEFLIALTPDAEEREYPLLGDEVFARVMSYETRSPGASVLETHKKYVDVQAVLAGKEGMEWFPAEGLAIDKPYDGTKEAQFYIRPKPGPARVDVIPGIFVAFFPNDAHMPSLMTGNRPERVKKMVVKIRAELLMP